MTHHFDYPGVYIEEQAGPGIIAGVGTSTAAFIGPARNGAINTPRPITSWEEFLDIYGLPNPLGFPDVYITSPRTFFMAHAVRGFFENGGRFAHIVRIGTAARAYIDLPAKTLGNALRVEALKEGLDGNNITVEVKDVSWANGINVTRASSQFNTATQPRRVRVADATKFRPGDIVTLNGTTERVTIERIDYISNDIYLTSDLGGAYPNGTLRIDDLRPGQKTFRLDSTAGLFPGSEISIQKGAGAPEYATVAGVRDGFITLEKGLTNQYGMTGQQVTVTSYEFELLINKPGSPQETWTNLSKNPHHPNYYEQAVRSTLVRVLPSPINPTTANPPDDRPAVPAPAVANPLGNGKDDNLAGLSATEFRQGIDALGVIDDANFVCMPDTQDPVIQMELVNHCLAKRDRVAILDAPSGQDYSGALNHRSKVTAEKGFAALYYPWIEIRDPTKPGERLSIPPSGHIAGIYARVDEQRGVHKAPANEAVRGAIGVERMITDNQQGPLNLQGVNVLRIFPGSGQVTVWGARTTADASTTDWRYISIRRLFLFLEESIEEGIRWAVFEPNNLQLWQKLKRTITEFLTRVWRDGALFGETADKAFYVRIDEALNPDSTRALGRLYIEIGVRPAYPAEFIIVRIGIWQGGAEVNEG